MRAARKWRRSSAADRTVDGTIFDSKAEAKRWCDLCLLQQAGVITELRRQVRFPLVIDHRPVKIRSDHYKNGRAAVYTADFTYWENGKYIVEDSKGFDDTTSKLRRAVVETIYQFQIKVTH